jgi:hypothetical protein
LDLGRSPDLVLLALYSPFLSTLDWAESAGHPDFLLQAGAEKAVNTAKTTIRIFLMAVKIGVSGPLAEKKSIKSGFLTLFSRIKLVYHIS